MIHKKFILFSKTVHLADKCRTFHIYGHSLKNMPRNIWLLLNRKSITIITIEASRGRTAGQGDPTYGKGNKMFRLWARTFKDNHMLQDTCIADGSADTRTHKVFRALDEVCYQFDLSRPIWLDKTIADFKRLGKARFTQDNFVDGVDFDYLEIQVIEED